jgi:C1A family cysteine protease
MQSIALLDGGWCRDLPDHRDYTRQHQTVQKMLRKLAPSQTKDEAPSRIDWREYCPPVEDQGELPTSCAHACIGLIQYFERRTSGRLISPSRLFLHVNARRLAGQKDGTGGASLRNTLKAAVKQGIPPERYWPYDPATLDHPPDGFVYGLERPFRRMRYVRLDPAGQTTRQTLNDVKAFLAAGFVCMMGFGVPSSLGIEPEIRFPTLFDSIHAGQAAMVVGYDDSLRIHSEKGAFLVRISWGASWGTDGYGWLPFRYVTDNVSADIWTVLEPRWLKSGEFKMPT